MPTRSPIAVTATTFGIDLREVVPRAQEAGFDGLVLSARTSALALADLSSTGRREVRHLIAGARLSVIGVQAELGGAGFGREADVDRLLHAAAKLFEATAELGGSIVCLDLGRLPAALRPVAPPRLAVTEAMMGLLILPVAAPAPAPMEAHVTVDSAALSIVTAALAQLGAAADKFGVTVAFSSGLSNLAALVQAVRSAQCPYFGFDLDPVAVLRDGWSLDETFNTLAGEILHVRGRDAVRGDGGRTKVKLLARGETDWRGLLDRLDHAAYAGPITIDPSELPEPAAAAITGLKQLRAMHE